VPGTAAKGPTVTDDRRTLGDLEGMGDLPPTGALKYEVLLGSAWRTLTVDEAKDTLNGTYTTDEQAVVGPDERERIVAKMTEHVERGEHIGSELAKKVLAELYGERPSRAAVDAMLAVMGNYEFRRAANVRPSADGRA